MTNVPFFVFNLTLHQDLVIKSVEEEAAVFYKKFFSELENHQNPLIKDLHTLTHPRNSRRRLKKF